MVESLTIGHIAYANCEPFFHYLRESGFEGRIHSGVPAELNRMLASGELDLSPSSSFEYLRNPDDYLLLPDFSISSFGAVKSVLLFSPEPIESLHGKNIYLTGESASSIHLLQILLREYFGFSEVLCKVPEGDLETLVHEQNPALLIGDRALRTAQQVPQEQIYDLGEMWRKFTGLPFVFALWIMRREVAFHRPQQAQAITRQLRSSLKRALEDLPGLADDVRGYDWLGAGGLVEYWQSMSYELTDQHVRGLEEYSRLLVKYGFLERSPRLEFVPG